MDKNAGLAVDIDDTLCATSRVCMELMAKELGTVTPFEVDQFVRKYRQPMDAPDWQTLAGEEWLKRHLLNPDFLLDLKPSVPALTSLIAINEFLPITCYISSREHLMHDATQLWLDKHHFPVAELVTRPSNMNNPAWKINYLNEHFPKIWGLIDNEIQIKSDQNFGGHLLQLQPFDNHDHSDHRVINLHSWEDGEKWIKNHLATT